MTEQVLPRQLIHELRLLRDAGYIRGFVASGDRCTVLLADGAVSGREDDLRQLIAQVKLWTLIHESADGTMVRRSALYETPPTV